MLPAVEPLVDFSSRDHSVRGPVRRLDKTLDSSRAVTRYAYLGASVYVGSESREIRGLARTLDIGHFDDASRSPYTFVLPSSHDCRWLSILYRTIIPEFAKFASIPQQRFLNPILVFRITRFLVTRDVSTRLRYHGSYTTGKAEPTRRNEPPWAQNEDRRSPLSFLTFSPRFHSLETVFGHASWAFQDYRFDWCG